MRGTWTCVLMLVISAFCLEAQEGDPGADVWVSADTYPPVIEGCLERWGFYYKVIVRMEPSITLRARPGA